MEFMYLILDREHDTWFYYLMQTVTSRRFLRTGKSHFVTPTLKSRHAKNKKFFKKYVICLPRDSDPSQVANKDYIVRHPFAVLLKGRAV